MKEIVFLLKMMGLSLVVALLLQVNLGEKTAEFHFHSWLKTSALVDWLQTAVDGGISVTKAGYTVTKSTLDPFIAKLSRRKNGPQDEADDRAHPFKLKRNLPKKEGEDQVP